MNKVWIITANMGYGHQRAVFPLRSIAQEKIITANNDIYNKPSENKLWDKTLRLYEFFSRMHSIPIIGKYLFGILDYFLKIPQEFDDADLSDATFQVKMLEKYIRKGLCNGTLQRLKTKDIPLLTSFYAPAIAADLNNFRKIYCIICDADLNRVWVARHPKKSHIQYFVPTKHAKTRLLQYGVKETHIHLTGFPLPLELLGNENLDVLKRNLSERLNNLDPSSKFLSKNAAEINAQLGKVKGSRKASRKLTIMFAVGGAGAQAEIAEQIATSLHRKITSGEVHLCLVAGIKRQVKYHFERLHNETFNASPHISIIAGETKDAYFQQFNAALHDTDILWTKPSELSFYCALGIPIIMAPAIGSQEKFNKKWLKRIGGGIPQLNPKLTDKWLFEFLENGYLATAAWSGFMNAEKKGTFQIMNHFN